MKIENKSIYHQHNEIDKNIQESLEWNTTKRRNRAVKWVLFILMCFGILNMLSIGLYTENLFSVKKYIVIIMGSFIFVKGVTSSFSYKLYRNKFMILSMLLGSAFLLLLVVYGPSSLVKSVNGAKGWLDLKVTTIQPSEMIKIPFVILMANVLAKGEEKKLPINAVIINSMLLFGIFGVLICLQNDLGTVIHYGAIYVFMLFFTNIDKKIITRTLSLAFVGAFSGAYLIYKYADKISGGYKLERIKMYIDGLITDKYIGNADIGYQVGQSLLAFGNGGIFGRSYGSGVQKYDYLPEIHTDFIMALFGEEMGFIGILIVIILFFILYKLILETGIKCKDIFGKYLSVGIAGYIISQFLINIFVALGLLPVFGIPMPIFSYGGSSIITIFAAAGIIININKSMFDKK